MSCFSYFKHKSRKWRQRSAPDLNEQEKSLYSGVERVAKSSGSTASPRGIPELYEEKAHNLRVFSFSELRHATNDFSRLFKIGEGGFGSVYKGLIKPVGGNGDPILVAIKRLNQDGLQVRDSEHFLRNILLVNVARKHILLKLKEYSEFLLTSESVDLV